MRQPYTDARVALVPVLTSSAASNFSTLAVGAKVTLSSSCPPVGHSAPSNTWPEAHTPAPKAVDALATVCDGVMVLSNRATLKVELFRSMAVVFSRMSSMVLTKILLNLPRP